MNTKILEELRKEFAFVGDERISGKTAMKIIDDTIERFTIPIFYCKNRVFVENYHGKHCVFQCIECRKGAPNI